MGVWAALTSSLAYIEIETFVTGLLASVPPMAVTGVLLALSLVLLMTAAIGLTASAEGEGSGDIYSTTIVHNDKISIAIAVKATAAEIADGTASVGRAVIDQNQFQIPVVLVQNTLNSLSKIRFHLINRHNDRNQIIHRNASLLNLGKKPPENLTGVSRFISPQILRFSGEAAAFPAQFQCLPQFSAQLFLWM